VFTFDEEEEGGRGSGSNSDHSFGSMSETVDSEDRVESEKVDKLKHLLADLFPSERTDSESEELQSFQVPTKSIRTSSMTEMGWSYSAETHSSNRRRERENHRNDEPSFKVVVDREGVDSDDYDFYENDDHEPSHWSSTRRTVSELSLHSVNESPDDDELSVSQEESLLFDFSSLVNDLKRANHK